MPSVTRNKGVNPTKFENVGRHLKIKDEHLYKEEPKYFNTFVKGLKKEGLKSKFVRGQEFLTYKKVAFYPKNILYKNKTDRKRDGLRTEWAKGTTASLSVSI